MRSTRSLVANREMVCWRLASSTEEDATVILPNCCRLQNAEIVTQRVLEESEMKNFLCRLNEETYHPRGNHELNSDLMKRRGTTADELATQRVRIRF